MSSSATSYNNNKMTRITSFSTIEIREYDVTLGDNPGGRTGPPLSLGWTYNKDLTQVVDLEQYEETRPPRRSRVEMHMGSRLRSYILMKEQGFSLRDIQKAADNAAHVRKNRQKTMKGVILREELRKRLRNYLLRTNKSSSS